MAGLPMDADILPPSDDRIFKVLLTHPNAKQVLINVVSTVIERKVIDAQVRNIELPAMHVEEKAERFDVNCVVDNGDQVNVEKWSLFFKYAPDPVYRGQINDIIKDTEEIGMAATLLQEISKDERERAILRSRRMAETDRISDLLTSEEIGEIRERGKWQQVVADKDAKLADKDAEIADNRAEILRLRSQIAGLRNEGSV